MIFAILPDEAILAFWEAVDLYLGLQAWGVPVLQENGLVDLICNSILGPK